MRTILKVIISAFVAVGAMGIYIVGLVFVPALEFLGFGCGIVFTWAVFCMMEGLEECDGGAGKQEAYFKKSKKNYRIGEKENGKQ